jgi:hypothetical protein
MTTDLKQKTQIQNKLPKLLAIALRSSPKTLRTINFLIDKANSPRYKTGTIN